MIRFLTTSGSVYELDEEEQMIRRVSGKNPVHHSFGEDGEWRSYEDVTEPSVGHSVWITWNYANAKSTITSTVVEILGQRAA